MIAGELIGRVGRTGSIAQGGPVRLHYQVWAIGPGREADVSSGVFTHRLGRAARAHAELVRLARGLGARVGQNGSVLFESA